MKVIGSIEARMGSTRLPGKTLMPVFEGRSLLECVVQRFRLCRSLDDVVVATSTEAGDDAIAEWCVAHGVSCFRGAEDNVLERVTGAALHYGADAIVQMGADSAYLDFQLIDQLVAIYQSRSLDYACNDLKLTYPLGVYAHVVSVPVLRELCVLPDLNDEDRSDVVRYIWEHPQRYAILNQEAPVEFTAPDLRLTIDYPEDMEQARQVYAYFEHNIFTTRDILALSKSRPDIFQATRSLVQHSAPFLRAHQ